MIERLTPRGTPIWAVFGGRIHTGVLVGWTGVSPYACPTVELKNCLFLCTIWDHMVWTNPEEAERHVATQVLTA